MIKPLALIFVAGLALNVYAGSEPTPPTKATEKPKVLKPCKEGQTAEKDNCHEVKKATDKKPEAKKDEKKK